MTSAPTSRQIFHGIWTMTGAMLRQASLLIGGWLILLVAMEAAKIAYPSDEEYHAALRVVLDVVVGILQAPIEFALFRLLILAEKPTGHGFDSGSQRFRNFLRWTLIFQIMGAPTSFFLHYGSDVLGTFGIFAFGVLLAIELYIVFRLALLLPALAAGGEGVTLRDAWADSRGRLWWIIKIVIGALLPILAIYIPAQYAFGYSGVEDGVADLRIWRGWVLALFEATMDLVMALLLLAATALAFLWVGNRVKQAHES